MTEKELKTLLDKYLIGECTADETTFVEGWYNRYAQDQSVDITHSELEEKRLQIKDNLPIPAQKRIFPHYIKYAAAAVVAIATITCVFYFSTIHHNTLTKNNSIVTIQPGGNNAILTLANGTKIDLKEDTRSQTLAAGEAVITNDTNNGVVVIHQVLSSKTAKENNLNKSEQKDLTITTPRGGQYKLVLPDGSSVLLNASSSLQFPSRFAANQRRVTLKGEAYFEVTKNAKQPFVVATKGQELTVLGTKFNISAYPDETIKTTLSQGSVQLLNSISLQKTRLKPEQQAVLTGTGFDLKEVNSANEMAWKRGLFIFRQTPLREALQQIERWYNVEVDYSNIPNVPLDAGLTRSLTLNRLIEILDENADLKFKLQGRRLIYVGK